MLGEPDGRPAQVATFLQDYEGTGEGEYRYVAGDGVEAAVDDGLIALGYVPRRSAIPAPPKEPVLEPQWYVRIGNNRWLGFRTKGAADRYAAIRDGVVLSREEVMNA
jgi:hypothetical protein